MTFIVFTFLLSGAILAYILKKTKKFIKDHEIKDYGKENETKTKETGSNTTS